MTLRIQLEPWESGRFLCFDYSCIANYLHETFPEIESEDWSEVSEYQNIEKFLSTSDVDHERGQMMLRQIRTKHISNGPSIRFTIPASDGEPPITGCHRRWLVSFKRDIPFSIGDRDKIMNFLESLNVGSLEEIE